MFKPQVMPTTNKLFDPWNEPPSPDMSDPWRAGGDPNASQGNAPAIAIPGAGNPPPLAPGGGEAMDGGYSGPVPQFTGSMGAGGGMKPMPMGGGGASIKPMAGLNDLGASLGAGSAPPKQMPGQMGGGGFNDLGARLGGGMTKPMGGGMAQPGGAMSGGMGGAMLKQLLLRKMQGGQ